MSSFAQRTITAQVFRTNTSLYLPFTHVIEGNHDRDFITDEKGIFQFDIYDKPLEFTFRSFMHRAKTVKIEPNTPDTINIYLNQNELFLFLRKTDPNSQKLIQRVIDNRKENNPNCHSPFFYETYSKFYLTSDNIDVTKSKLKKILKKLSFDMKDFDENHHLLLTESTTKRAYLDKVCENEVISASKASGIKKPSFFTVGSQIQPFSIYESHINMAGTAYTSPITKRTFKRYVFQILDTIPRERDTVFVVKFNSKISKRFEGLKGLLFISNYKYGVERMIMEPTIDRSLGTKLVKINTLVNDSIWFPKMTKTMISLFNMGNDKLNFIGIAQTDIKQVHFDTTYKRKQFSEVVYQVDDSLKNKNEQYWESVRSTPLNRVEKTTYTFYDSVGTFNNFDNILRFTERVYYKKIPYKFLDIDTRQIININQHEGLRLGLGLATNEKVSNLFSVGGYFGHGFRDKVWKYGFNGEVYITPDQEWKIFGSWKDDVNEAGNTFFTHDKYQYSSEGARKLKVKWMDHVRESEMGLQLRLFQYLRSSISLLQSHNRVLYKYTFQGINRPEYTLTEMRIGFKYNYGERFLKIHHHKISLGSTFPKIWFQYTRGINNLLDGDFKYRKVDVKLEYDHNFLDIGKMNLQLIGGVIEGDIPYYKLYNGKGSREVGAVAHNSFETMSYNEYLSNRYISFFYTQQFGKLHFVRFKNYTPSIEMLHGVGFGTLSNQGSHQNINYKTMEKGYFESGLAINQLVMFKTPLIRSGFGVAYFYKYGPDASTRFWNNSFVKLSFNFKL